VFGKASQTGGRIDIWSRYVKQAEQDFGSPSFLVKHKQPRSNLELVVGDQCGLLLMVREGAPGIEIASQFAKCGGGIVGGIGRADMHVKVDCCDEGNSRTDKKRLT
jgi:hypothetical protein